MTYSDRIEGLRAFLRAHAAIFIKATAFVGECSVIEVWKINGRTLMVIIGEEGAWDSFLECSAHSDNKRKVADMEKQLQGIRPNVEFMEEMTIISKLFLDKLQEIPGCSDPDCIQTNCTEKRKIQSDVESLLHRIDPLNQKKEHDAIA